MQHLQFSGENFIDTNSIQPLFELPLDIYINDQIMSMK